MKFRALDDLVKDMKNAPHDFRASTQIFPSINAEKLGSDLAVHQAGAERGTKELPSSDEKGYDTFELKVVERIEDENRSAQSLFEDELHTYSDRLASLDFKGQFERVRNSSIASISDFKATVQLGIDDLHSLRSALSDASDEKKAFQRQHQITRAPRINSTLWMFLKIALIVLLIIIETGLNGVFLAEGSSQGLLGGLVQALAFAVLNIVVALLLSIFAVRLVTHRSFVAKTIGTVALLSYFGALLGINLALAHYREVAPTFFDGAGREVMNRLLSDPFVFSDINSWILFGIGALFSIIAFIDGWYLTDPYVGYAGVEKRLRSAQEAYANMRRNNIEELQDLRDEHSEKIEQISRGLSTRMQEHESIISGRARLVSLLSEHQKQLERATNLLISQYREANIEARQTPAPPSFSEVFQLTIRTVPPSIEDGWSQKGLNKEISKTQKELTKQIEEVSQAFQEALDRYKALDELHPDS